MASNIISDQQRLIIDENEDPPTYQQVTNAGKQFSIYSLQ